MKKLKWTKPWFLISAIGGEGTRELTFKVMDFLEAGKHLSSAKGADA